MSGYTDSHGSLCSQALAGFFARSKDVYQDNKSREILVSRARYLNITSTISRAIHDCLTRGVVGSGIRYEPTETSDFFDYYSDITKELKKAFKKCSYSKLFDSSHSLTFEQLEQLVFYTMIVSGEAWLFRKPDSIEWKVKEPDYIKTPAYLCSDSINTSFVKYGENYIYDGIEITESGLPVACWYCIDPYCIDTNIKDNYTRIPFVDDEGVPLVIHAYIKERPDQLRGLPLTAPVITQLWSTLAYSDSELQMAILQCNQSLIITTNTNPTTNPFGMITQRELNSPLIPDVEDTEKTTEQSKDFSIFPPMGTQYLDGLINRMNFISPGQSHHLAEGEDVKFLSPTAPSTGLSGFIDLQIRQIGSSLGIPEQVLSGKFDSNFSAVKGSCAAYNHTVKRYRKVLIESFLKPFFEVFSYFYIMQNGDGEDKAQAVEASKLLALESVWIPNDSPLTLDPTKEIDYYLKAVESGLITRDEAAQALFGHLATGTPQTTKYQENKENIDQT